MLKKFIAIFSSVMIAMAIATTADAARKKKKNPNAGGGGVQVYVDVSAQTMSVRVGGRHYANWRVSTAKPGYYTPRGSYGVQRMHRVYFSRKYDNAPMPNSIFFRGPYAIHGTYHTKALGRPASRGCVRLAPGNAAQLYALVQRSGGRARITVVN